MTGRLIVIGGGHAGCEAALAAARMGIETVLFAINLDSIAMMPCNPCIGGSAKGHLVREIDALGGQMGKTIDATYLQSKMLNRSKGPAVYSLRAQADKRKYMAAMKRTLEAEPNLTVRQGEVLEILTENNAPSASNFSVSAAESSASNFSIPVAENSASNFSIPAAESSASNFSIPAAESSAPNFSESAAKIPTRITGVRIESGAVIPCDAVIVCAGTYMEARCLYGETITQTGPNGQKASRGLSENLKRLGFSIMRFKTGTPARVHRRSIDFSKMEPQHGDGDLTPFSFETDPSLIVREQLPCYLTYTTPETHGIIRAQAHRSPMFNGLIEGTGTRYCPSIEDKVVRFADKQRHPVFIEPEGEDTEEIYVQGMSSSLPEDVQIAAYRSVPGMERCEIMRNAYAIEYDCIDATQLRLTLEAKHIRGLYTAGQVNGSSGYEEAAAQGLIAGINAALALKNEPPLEINRSEGYIGVLIDDLVTKGTAEPYRMMTSRAEYRLLLRQDNADLRLTEKGYAAGLISQERRNIFQMKKEWIEWEVSRVKKVNVAPSKEVNVILTEAGGTEITTGCKLSELIKRPELSYKSLESIDTGRPARPVDCPDYIWQTIGEQVNIQVKYEGYIAIQMSQAAAFKKLEDKRLPADLDYTSIAGLRLEARQKLDRLRPANVGQASRITGVSPADMNVLLVYLKTI